MGGKVRIKGGEGAGEVTEIKGKKGDGGFRTVIDYGGARPVGGHLNSGISGR